LTNFRAPLGSALFLFATLLAACGGGGGGGSPAPAPTPTVTAVKPTPTPTLTATPTPVPSLPPQAARLIVPATGAYFGAYVNTSTSTPLPNPPSNESELLSLEAQVGRKFSITQHYYAWTDTFPGPAVPVDYSEGRVPILSWGCGDSDVNVAAGKDDATVVIPTAIRLKNLAKPVFLRWFWDMNTMHTPNFRNVCYDPATDGSSGFFSATEYVAAWQHIWNVFQAQGATNVIFVWAPSGVTGAPSGTPYYPGSGYVDWLGIDRFDYLSLGFAKTYTAAYAQLSTYVKPIMIAETGAVATAQQAFFDPASGPSDVTTLQTQLPFVKAYVYYDGVYNNFLNTPVNYILTDPTAAGNFATFGSNAFFAPFPNLLAP
jgi:hypothetical protein